MFQRTTPSARLNQAIRSIQWSYGAKRPEEGHWELLKRDGASRANLVAAHNVRLKHNADFYTNLEKNLIEAERKREEE